jgi:hypothetical protein
MLKKSLSLSNPKTYQMKRLIFLLTLLSVLSSCSVSLVPDYNPALEEQISEAAMMNDRLYLDLLNIPISERSFQAYAPRYSEIESEINSIRMKNEIRPNNTEMLKIIDLLKSNFVQYKEEHKAKSTGLTDGEIRSYSAFIRGFWLPLLTAENALHQQRNKK